MAAIAASRNITVEIPSCASPQKLTFAIPLQVLAGALVPEPRHSVKPIRQRTGCGERQRLGRPGKQLSTIDPADVTQM
ncbi:hypothetical protein ACVOMV_06710 [Mesorhizobium atlanticum]